MLINNQIRKYNLRVWDMIILLVVLFIVFFEAKGQGDFHIYLQASNDIFKGENIYIKMYHEWFHYYYDSLFVIILYPFTFLPFYLANLIWLLLSAILTFFLFNRIWTFLPKDILGAKENRYLSYIAFLFLFFTWQKNIHVGQITIVILYLCVESIYQILKGNKTLGSFLLGIGISIKIMPIVLIPYLVYKGYFKAVILTISCVILFTISPILFIGLDQQLFLIGERWKMLNPNNAIHVLDVEERSFHSITTLLSVLFVENARNNFTLDYVRNIADVSLDSLKWIILLVRLFFIGLTIYFLDRKMFQPSGDRISYLYAMSYILLITPLIFPHQQQYAFFFALPAVIYILFVMKYLKKMTIYSSLKFNFLVLILGFIFILLNAHFYLGFMRNILDHYKLFTYGVLLLIPVLMILNPKKMKYFETNENSK
jgi:hypothetical protein